MNIETDRLAEGLKMLRRGKGDTLRDVESATGISNAYLSQLERGSAKNPTAAVLFKLAKHYGVSYEELLAMAGHISKAPGQERSAVSQAQVALKSAELSEEEDKQVVDFLHYLVSRRKG